MFAQFLTPKYCDRIFEIALYNYKVFYKDRIFFVSTASLGQAVCVCVNIFTRLHIQDKKIMRAEEIKHRDLITIENLFQAWNEFAKGKKKKIDVQEFERNLEDNLFELHHLLTSKTYRHGLYEEFYVNDPKRRHIHKATVCDRVVHHLLYKYLYELFDTTFMYDSYSCRVDRGTNKGVRRLAYFVRQVSKNYIRDCWVLKLDAKKFFANVDHETLLKLLRTKIRDQNILWLLLQVIESFSSKEGKRKGIPLGNLTSQVFANIYMNELDHYVKHNLKIKYYLRYADDFIISDSNKDNLYQCINILKQFLFEKLRLELHPDKIIVRKLSWGIDFLGYIVLPYYILPRSKTIRRMFKRLEVRAKDYYRGKIDKFCFDQTLASYFGFLSHANSFRLRKKIYFSYYLEDKKEGRAGEY